MKEKTVIRIEHPSNGKGLFRSNVIRKHSRWKFISNRHTNIFKFPSFYYDEKLKYQYYDKHSTPSDQYLYKYKFAFHNIAQLSSALTADELKECINKLGFKILEIKLSSFIESPYQVIFTQDDVISIKDISYSFK